MSNPTPTSSEINCIRDIAKDWDMPCSYKEATELAKRVLQHIEDMKACGEHPEDFYYVAKMMMCN